MTTQKDEHSDCRQQEVDELHRAIGEFVVAFELSCHAMQSCVMGILAGAGLRDQQVAHIILSGVTAGPLREMFQSLIGQRVQLNKIERGIIKNLVDRFQELTQERNNIIHSAWYIGWGNEETVDFSDASGIKFHKNKEGAAIKSFSRKSHDFSLLTNEAKALENIFRRLNGCLVFSHSVERNFVVGKCGRVSVPFGSDG